MNTSVVASAPCRGAPPAPSDRLVDVLQNTKRALTTIGVGRPSHYAADVLSLTVLGKTYQAKLLDVFWVTLPKLPDGLHKGTVNLANGAKCPITLRVTTYG